MSTSRNDPCPCGSGKKYKNCCEAKASSMGRNKSLGLLGAGVLIAAVLLGRAFLASDAGQPASQPPGAAPIGKVWSEEHGHWHDDLAGRETATSPVTATAQPPGPVPEGKEWSSEHGHWHDIPGTRSATDSAAVDSAAASIGSTEIPQPDGPVPEGKVWSSTHGHWHTAPTQISADSLPQE